MKNPNLMPFRLWMFTILCVAIAMIFGLVSSIFAVINTVMTPIEIITGIQGLFLWNGMGALFCTGACISWLVQFRNKLRKNVMTNEEIKDGWTSENRARLGYSFFMVVIALGLFLFNVLLIGLATRRRSPRNKARQSTDKNPEGVIMLYWKQFREFLLYILIHELPLLWYDAKFQARCTFYCITYSTRCASLRSHFCNYSQL